MKLVPNFDKTKNVFSKLGSKLGNISASSFKKQMIKHVLKGVIEEKLEGVRPDQVYTHIVDGASYSNLLASEGKTIPDNSMNILRNLNRFVDVQKELNKIEPMIDSNCGLIVLEIIRKERPDLYKVIVNTQGGRSMIWSDARRVWSNIKEEIRNARL